MQGKMWRVIKGMYESSRSAVLLEGEKSEVFNVEQGFAQGCSLSPILFSVFINGLLVAVEQAGLGTELSDGGKVGGLLFADDFVGVSESGEQLQRVIDVVHSCCRKFLSSVSSLHRVSTDAVISNQFLVPLTFYQRAVLVQQRGLQQFWFWVQNDHKRYPT